MSVLSMLTTGRLSEKPWKAGAVVRLAASVAVCFFIGAAVAMVFRYFEMREHSSEALFLAFIAAAVALFITAIVVLMRRWPPEAYLSRLIGLLLCVYGGFLLLWLSAKLIHGKTELDNPILAMIIAVLSFQAAALILVHFFLREHHTNWADGFGLRNETKYALILGACVGLLTLVPAWLLQDLSARLFETFSVQTHEQEAVTILRNAEGWPQHLALGIATILIAPLGEEVLFRGILYPAIKRTGRPQLALWSTAILFGAIHANLASFVPLTLLAVVLVWLYEYTGNLLACFGVHCIFNAANFAALYLMPK